MSGWFLTWYHSAFNMSQNLPFPFWKQGHLFICGILTFLFFSMFYQSLPTAFPSSCLHCSLNMMGPSSLGTTISSFFFFLTDNFFFALEQESLAELHLLNWYYLPQRKSKMHSLICFVLNHVFQPRTTDILDQIIICCGELSCATYDV